MLLLFLCYLIYVVDFLVLAGPAGVFISFSCQKETKQRKGHPKKTLHAQGLRTAAVFWEAWLLSGASILWSLFRK